MGYIASLYIFPNPHLIMHNILTFTANFMLRMIEWKISFQVYNGMGLAFKNSLIELFPEYIFLN